MISDEVAMKRRPYLLPLGILTVFLAPSPAQEKYPLGPDSERQGNVPKGVVTRFTWTSKLYPGSVRDYWVYVPAQYEPDKPAPVMIFLDGAGFIGEQGRWRAPIVFDNLFAKGDMPPAIGIFVDPEILPAPSPGQQPRFNRSFEYDALGDLFARLLIEEILPEVGKLYKLSSDPNDRAIAGSSSGGIAAFNAAWNRPDALRWLWREARRAPGDGLSQYVATDIGIQISDQAAGDKVFRRTVRAKGFFPWTAVKPPRPRL
jgi:Putative esterase